MKPKDDTFCQFEANEKEDERREELGNQILKGEYSMKMPDPEFKTHANDEESGFFKKTMGYFLNCCSGR